MQKDGLIALAYCVDISLTLFAPRGGGQILGPHATYLRISVQIQIQARWKKLSFPNYKWEMAVRFLPRKIILFCRKNKVHRNTQIS